MKVATKRRIGAALVLLGLVIGGANVAAASTVIKNGVIYDCNVFGQCKVIGTIARPIGNQ